MKGKEIHSLSKSINLKVKQKYYHLNHNKLILFFFKIFFLNSVVSTTGRILINNKSEIKLVVQGTGTKTLLSSRYNGLIPSEILVNGVKDDTCSTTCTFKDSISNLTLIFNSPFESLYEIFRGLNHIIEADLSNFDTSKLKDMTRIFYDCANIKKIYFGDFNTKSVTSMRSLFKGCSSLTSVDVSKFNTSINTSLYQWFMGCTSLKYIDLSNFDTSKVQTMEKMFLNCESLIYVNLKSFKLKGSVALTRIFDGISTYVNYCINDATLLDKLPANAISNCPHDCFKEGIKVDIKNNICVWSCGNKKYEENNVCLNECTFGSYRLFCEGENCEDEQCYKEAPQGYYLDAANKIYKKCFKNCYNCYGPGNVNDNNCSECNRNFIFLKNITNTNNCYEKCDYYFYFDMDTYHCTEEEKCPDKYNKLIINQTRCIDECKKDDIYKFDYNNNCVEKCPLDTISDEKNFKCFDKSIETEKEEIRTIFIPKHNVKTDYIPKIKSHFIQDIYTDLIVDIKDEFLQEIQTNIKNKFNATEIDKGNDTVYTKDNIIYTITSTSNQKNNKNNSNASSIDLGDCEYKLKKENNIPLNDNLYILKIDALIGKMNKIEYEVYYPFIPNQLTKLDLSICKNMKANITIPIYIPPNEIDKYNKSSALYNNICYTLETENGTDKPLIDRKNEYVNNMSICEEDCEFTDYDIINQKALCSCYIKVKLPLISEIKINKEQLLSNFKNIKNIANFKLLNCYYLLLNAYYIFKNSANYIVAILIILGIISLFSFICYDIIKIKNFNNQNEKKKRSYNNKKYILTKNNGNNKKKTNRRNLLTENINNQRRFGNNLLNINRNNKKRSNIPMANQFLFLNANKNNNNKRNKSISLKNYHQNENINKNKHLRLNNRKKTVSNTKGKNTSLINSNYLMKRKDNHNIKNKFTSKKENKNIVSYNDYEMNHLNYERAKNIDHRTYCQYYLSLLRIKYILFFSFFLHKDYNSQMIKIYLFFLTFDINYLISAMFYSESIIHKIYIDNGSFDFTYQLPQMIYSFIISTFLKNIINVLGLYEPNIVIIKNSKNLKETIQKELFNIKCKIFLFFIFTYLIIFFSWFYLGCFCAVYKNTQIHLLKQVSSSFLISLITPFFIYLLPGIFRIKSLRDRTKRPLLFKFSKLLQIF